MRTRPPARCSKTKLAEVPVHVADNLTPAQVRAYRLLDNRSHEETSWDEDLLGFELLDLKSMGIDMDLTGFDLSEINALLPRIDTEGDLTDVDTAPQVPEIAVSRPGDLWVLGIIGCYAGTRPIGGYQPRARRGPSGHGVL